jgi:protein-export membrane protein SecD
MGGKWLRVVAAVAGLAVLGVPLAYFIRAKMRDRIGKSGGVMLRYEVDVAHRFNSALSPEEALHRTAETVRQRVAKLADYGTVEVHADQLVVILPAAGTQASTATIKRLLERTARLEFRLVDDGAAFADELARRVKERHPDVTVETDTWESHRDPYLAAPGEAALRAALQPLPDGVTLPADHELVLGEEPRAGGRWRTYYLYRAAEVTDADIRSVEAVEDRDRRATEVELTFDALGAQRFEALTARSVGRKLAIVLEGRVTSAPVIRDKIGGGHARITTGASDSPEAQAAEARDLAAVLRAGSLAAPITLAYESQVGPLP